MSGAGLRAPDGCPPGERLGPPAAGAHAGASPAHRRQGDELVLATRGSDLALAQTRLAGDALAAAHPGVGWRPLTIATRGDRSAGGGQAAAGNELAAMAKASPGLFTSEVAAAVARGDASAGVHSLKDLPLDDHEGLCLAAVLPRAAAGDVLVVAPGWIDAAAPLALRSGATVGTSSPRRAALVRHFAPQARVVAVRGNVPTRLRRCADGELAAVALAQAGLQRLHASLAGLRLLPLPPEYWHPAPGQGALAVQTRRDGAARDLLAVLDHAPTRTAVELERAVLRAFGGGCAAPCGAWARRLNGDEWELHYGAAATDGGGRWRSYLLRGTAAGCRGAIDAWADGGPMPGREQPAEAAQAAIKAVLSGAK